VAQFAGLSTYTFNTFDENNGAVMENCVAQAFLVVGGVMVMTASNINEISGAITYTGTGELNVLGGEFKLLCVFFHHLPPPQTIYIYIYTHTHTTTTTTTTNRCHDSDWRGQYGSLTGVANCLLVSHIHTLTHTHEHTNKHTTS
jgi:hypothetical protein